MAILSSVGNTPCFRDKLHIYANGLTIREPTIFNNEELNPSYPAAPFFNDSLHSFPNIINYIYRKFHNDLACIRAVMDQNVKQCSDFAVYFYQIRWFDITAFAFKAPQVQEVVEITASRPLHSFANIINYIYSKFHTDFACIRVVMDQNVKQCTDFAVYFYQIRWFDITAFASKAPKVLEVVEITASGSPPFVCKYYKIYIQ